MKKLSLLFALCVVFAFSANAQEYKKFRWNLGLGYASPSGSGAKGGVLFYSEPGYRISDQLLVGLRMEWAVVARGYSSDVQTAGIDASASGSWALTGQYYFSNNNFRPYAGLGVGLYSIKSAAVSASGDNAAVYAGDSGSKFGFFPRVGFDVSHFNFGIEYNLVGKTTLSGVDANGQRVPDLESKNSYLGVKIGWFISGGKK